MSMKITKILGILLAVCFLMSVTAAAVSADPIDNTKLTDKNMSKMKLTKGLAGMKLAKGLSQEKEVNIQNLVIIKNLVIINNNLAHPLLRAAALKKMMTNDMNNSTDMSNTGTADDDNTGTADSTYTADNNT
jgi:hypothetical protein